MIVLYSVIGVLIVMVAIAVQVRQQIIAHDYSWTNFTLITVAWGVLILPGIRSVCAEAFCRWSVSFTWWILPLGDIAPFNTIDPKFLLNVAIITVSAVTAYFLGHVLGWIFYGVRRLGRAVA